MKSKVVVKKTSKPKNSDWETARSQQVMFFIEKAHKVGMYVETAYDGLKSEYIVSECQYGDPLIRLDFRCQEWEMFEAEKDLDNWITRRLEKEKNDAKRAEILSRLTSEERKLLGV